MTAPLAVEFFSGTAGATAGRRAAVPCEVSEALFAAVAQATALKSLLDLRPFRRHRHVRGERPLAAEQLDLLAP